MIVEVMLRRRPAMHEAIAMLNAGFIESLADLSNFWKSGKSMTDALFDSGAGESATLDLNNTLVEGLKGQIVYAARFDGYLDRNVAQSDDFLVVYLNTEKVEYKEFCNNTLPCLIDIFSPYRMMVETDKSVRRLDWKAICNKSEETGRDIDGRDSVFRIWPVSFFDDILCRSSFGISAEELVRCVSLKCERAEILNGGAFLVVTSSLVVGDALNDLNASVMSCLDN